MVLRSAVILYLLYRLGVWKKVKIRLRPEGEDRDGAKETEKKT